MCWVRAKTDDMQLSLKDIAECLLLLEREINIQAFSIRGINVWPILRKAIWIKLLHPYNQYSVPEYSTISTCSDIKMEEADISFHESVQTLPVEPVDILFVCAPEVHRNILNGKKISKTLDPLMDVAGKKLNLRTAKIATRAFPDMGEDKYWYAPTAIDYSGYSCKLRQARADHSEFVVFWKAEFQQTWDHVLRLVDGTDFSLETIIDEFLQVEVLAEYYSDILDRTQPKAIFYECFFSIENMAFNLAARGRKIQTVDIQHGQQGKYHGLYTYWNTAPQMNYELLPNTYWVWGEQSKINLAKWQSKSNSRIVIGGNMWVQKWKNSNTADEEEFRGLTSGEKNRCILFSLQPLPDPVPRFVLNAIKNSPKDWDWVFRFHPNMDDNMRKEVCELLENTGVANRVGIDSGTDLYGLLSRSFHHITGYSSVAYEAVLFGVPTTIVSKKGAELFDKEIGDGCFFYSDSAESLVTSIRERHRFNICKENRYFELEESVATNAINEILEK